MTTPEEKIRNMKDARDRQLKDARDRQLDQARQAVRAAEDAAYSNAHGVEAAFYREASRCYETAAQYADVVDLYINHPDGSENR